MTIKVTLPSRLFLYLRQHQPILLSIIKFLHLGIESLPWQLGPFAEIGGDVGETDVDFAFWDKEETEQQKEFYTFEKHRHHGRGAGATVVGPAAAPKTVNFDGDYAGVSGENFGGIVSHAAVADVFLAVHCDVPGGIEKDV